MEVFKDTRGNTWQINKSTKTIKRIDCKNIAGINKHGVNYYGSIHGSGFYYQPNFIWCGGIRGEIFNKVNELFN